VPTEKTLDQRIRNGFLLDAYGGLLTEKQRQACDMVLLQDLSLSEAAESLGVSRQGIHDLITRAREHMEYSEQRLRLLEKEASREKMMQLLEERRAELPQGFYEEFIRLLEI